jgi:hypothetical protein
MSDDTTDRFSKVHIRELQSRDPINDAPAGEKTLCVPDGDPKDTVTVISDDGLTRLEIANPIVATIRFDEALPAQQAMERALEIYPDEEGEWF